MIPEPELILTNARVLTMDASAPRAEAVALAASGIVAVGNIADIAAPVGRATRVFDAKGRTLLPGFIESHMHLFAGGAELDPLRLALVRGAAALSALVRSHAKGAAMRVDLAICGGRVTHGALA